MSAETDARLDALAEILRQQAEATGQMMEIMRQSLSATATRRNPASGGADPTVALILEELRASRDREAALVAATRAPQANPLDVLEIVTRMQDAEDRTDRQIRVIEMVERAMSLYAATRGQATTTTARRDGSGHAGGGAGQPAPSDDA